MEAHDRPNDLRGLRPQRQPVSPKRRVGEEQPLVLLVDDDDERSWTALQELVLSVGIDSACFASTRELLESEIPDRPGYLIGLHISRHAHRLTVITQAAWGKSRNTIRSHQVRDP
jgi:hypothetical protein